LYALSGFCALSLEIVWFRAVGVMLKAPAVAFAIGQLEQDVEHERFERQKAVDTVAVLAHAVTLLSE
jgi:hypothetical protein